MNADETDQERDKEKDKEVRCNGVMGGHRDGNSYRGE
jgi:hypothetical protein